MSQLLSKIDDRSAHVCVVGLGYVGLPLALAFSEAGFRVTGIDKDPRKVGAVNAGETYVPDVSTQYLSMQLETGRLAATTDTAVLKEVDTVHICVPTPLGKTRDPDLSYVGEAANDVARHFRSGLLIVLESTTYPGTTEEVLLPMFEKDGHRAGVDFFLAFSPERIDPGNRTYTLRNTPKIVGGVTSVCGSVTEALYSTIVDQVHRVSSTGAAELVKLLENSFRAVNIALVNEMALMCERLGINTWEVIEAAATKPFGYMPFLPGPGLGGHCIPVDPHYLTWKVRTLNYRARLIELAAEINSEMPGYVLQKVVDALNERGKSVKGSRILMLGVAYKRDVSDTRESPCVDIMHLLSAKGAEVRYNDPYVTELGAADGFNPPLRSIDGLPGVCADFDCVIVGTDHTSIDWQQISAASRLLVDTRNVCGDHDASHIVRL